MLYFLPKQVAHPTSAQIAAVGLGYAFEGEITGGPLALGPSGDAGYLLCQAGLYEVPRYQPDLQTWRKVPLSPAWVGFITASPPLPAQLRRKKTASTGVLLTLADDQVWEVPVSRRYVEEEGEARYQHKFPCVAQVNDTGEWSMAEILPRYAELWEISVAYNAFQWGGPANPRYPCSSAADFLGYALTALQFNYRLGAAEVSLLKLLTPQLARQILDLLIDSSGCAAIWQKKRTQPVDLVSVTENTLLGDAA